jgi:hypothetical protein
MSRTVLVLLAVAVMVLVGMAAQRARIRAHQQPLASAPHIR